MRQRHMMSRKYELIFGIGFFILGCWLLYCAFDMRGKKMPWPASGVMPW